MIMKQTSRYTARIKNISEELDIKEETVKKILFEKGLIENV